MTAHYFAHLIQLIISPGHGWEDIDKSDADPEELTRDGLYPLLGLVALSVFVQKVYDGNLDLVTLLCRALAAFVAFFATCYLAPVLLSLILDGSTSDDGPLDERCLQTFTVYSLSVMAIIAIITNCIPVEVSVVQLLPIYVAFVIWKGSEYLDIRQNRLGLYIVSGFIILVGLPVLTAWLFGLAI